MAPKYIQNIVKRDLGRTRNRTSAIQASQAIETERGLLTVIAFVSLGSLFAAFLGQQVFDIEPCILCIYQRIPYVAAALIAGAAAVLPVSSGFRRLAVGLCTVIFAAGALLAFYSVGVEEHWWAGVTGCDATAVPATVNVDDLQASLAQTSSGLRPCDENVWRLFGLSLAAYNVAVQLVAAAACILGLRRLMRRSRRA